MRRNRKVGHPRLCEEGAKRREIRPSVSTSSWCKDAPVQDEAVRKMPLAILSSAVSDAKLAVLRSPVTTIKKKWCWLGLVALCAVSVVLLVVTLSCTLPPRARGRHESDWLPYYQPLDSPELRFQHAAVASNDERCSEIGRSALQSGGNAVDAVIATSVCLGFVNPHFSGIGGGFMALVYMRKEKSVYALNAREVAPLASSPTMFVNKSGASVTGNMAISVPSEVAGLHALHQRFGRLAWNALIQPTVQLCHDGIRVSAHLAFFLQLVQDRLRKFENLRRLYFNDAGQPLGVGDWLRDPLLARTLQRVALDPLSFYNGSLADDVIADVCQDTGTHACVMTRHDLSQYRVQWKQALSLRTVHNTRTYLMPLPSSSAIGSLYLNVFELYALSPADFRTPEGTARFYHRFTEVSKHAFALRTLLGDEGFALNYSQLIERSMSRQFAEYVKSRINDTQTNMNASYYLPPTVTDFNIPIDRGTTHVTVLDSEGNAVSLTSTINDLFGSSVRGTRTGIVFNNEMDDFSVPNESNNFGLPPGFGNFPEPGKRPLSSMSPIIVLNEAGDVQILIGAIGGPLIITSTMDSLLRMLYLNDTVKQALDAPRTHHQFLPDVLYHEASLNPELLRRLSGFGHTLEKAKITSIVQAIQVLPTGAILAYSDPRGGGKSAGY